MNPILERAIRNAADWRSEGRADWARPIAEAIIDSQLSAANPDELEPLVRDRFTDCESECCFDHMVGEIISESPVMADRAMAAICWQIGTPSGPAVIVDWETPGSTWVTIYEDHSLLDSDLVPWADWRDFFGSLYIPDHESEFKNNLFISVRNEQGRQIVRALADVLEGMGYSIVV